MSLFALWFLITGVAGLKAWLPIAAGCSGVVAFAVVFGWGTFLEGKGGFPKVAKWCIIFTTIASLLGSILPTNKQLMWIVGAYVVTNNEQVKELPDNILRAANDFLKELHKTKTE